MNIVCHKSEDQIRIHRGLFIQRLSGDFHCKHLIVKSVNKTFGTYLLLVVFNLEPDFIYKSYKCTLYNLYGVQSKDTIIVSGTTHFSIKAIY